jgi:hypothetical protein
VAVSTTNLILGPATLYIGAFGATEPAASAVGTVPASAAWTDLGGTTDGVSYTIDQSYTELEVDQIVDRAGSRLTGRTITVTTNLAEGTLTNLAYALNDGSIVTGAGYSTYDPAFASSATQPTYRSLLIDGFAPNSKRRRFIVRKVLSTDSVETAYNKDSMTVFSVTWTAHYVTSAISPFQVVDEQ